jgi:hypothetical protein
VGFQSAVWQTLIIAATILAALLIYQCQPVIFVLYGVAMTGIGMLTLTGNNVAMDSFGPIVDNANGIGEMAGLDPKARQILGDRRGRNTTNIPKAWPSARSSRPVAVRLVPDRRHCSQSRMGVPGPEPSTASGLTRSCSSVFRPAVRSRGFSPR